MPIRILLYIKLLWQLMRPLTLIVIILHGVLIYVLLSQQSPDYIRLSLGVVIVALAYVHAAAINDISDEEVDRINLRSARYRNDRPLINGIASQRTLWAVTVITSVVIIVLAWLLVWWFAAIAAIVLVMNCLYSLKPVRISARGALAQMVLPIMYVGFPTAIVAAIVNTVTPQVIIVAVGMYIVFVGRLFLKDIRDEKGDRRTGKRTYIVRHGLRATLIQSGLWIVAGGLLLFAALLPRVWVLLPILLLSNGVVLWALRRCYIEKRLDVKLLYVAIVGRAATMWLFTVIVWLILASAAVPLWQKLGFLILAVGVFLFGLLGLYEELAARIQKGTNLHVRIKAT